MTEKSSLQDRAEAARDAGIDVAMMVYEKQLAYGDASGIQHAIWKALLKQYEGRTEADGTFYMMPVELMDHIPRLTRVFDRICRIVSNPAADRMGEDPWRDLTGDGMCGIVMPRTQQPKVRTDPGSGQDHSYRPSDDLRGAVEQFPIQGKHFDVLVVDDPIVQYPRDFNLYDMNGVMVTALKGAEFDKWCQGAGFPYWSAVGTNDPVEDLEAAKTKAAAQTSDYDDLPF